MSIVYDKNSILYIYNSKIKKKIHNILPIYYNFETNAELQYFSSRDFYYQKIRFSKNTELFKCEKRK